MLGREFTLRTNHNSLVWAQNFKEPEGQLACWLQKLEEYNFTIVHRRGALHSNANTLSRIPCRQCGTSNHNKDEVPSDVEQTVPLTVSQDPGNMGHQIDDDQIQPVYLAVQNGHQPPLDVTKSWSRESRLLLQQWESLRIKNGILWSRRLGGKETDLQFVLPTEFQADVLRSLHEGGYVCPPGRREDAATDKGALLLGGMYQCGQRLLCNMRHMLHTEISYPKAEDGSANNPGWISITNSLCGHNGPSSRNRSRKLVCLGGSRLLHQMSGSLWLTQPGSNDCSQEARGHSNQGQQFESALVKEICNIGRPTLRRTTRRATGWWNDLIELCWICYQQQWESILLIGSRIYAGFAWHIIQAFTHRQGLVLSDVWSTGEASS